MEETPAPKNRPEIWEIMAKHTGQVSDATPQAREIGVIITEVTKANATGTMEWREDLVGDVQSGTIASGAVITFVDQICGAACMAALTEPAGFATLDLRIDYLRPSRRGHKLRAHANCYRISRHVAFVRAFVFDGESDDDKIAAVQATFMIIKSRKDMLKREAAPPPKPTVIPATPTVIPRSTRDPRPHEIPRRARDDSEFVRDDSEFVRDDSEFVRDDSDFMRDDSELVQDDHSFDLLSQLQENVPYIAHLGLVFAIDGDNFTTSLPYKPELVGNPLLPALHGGVIAAMMELTAVGQVVIAGGSQKLPKTIDVSIDYLRTGKPEPTFARAKITKLGRQIANVEAVAWQSDETKPIAKLHGHFLLAGEG